MTLDADACYRALRTRDARFDGRFFTAVKTTGVFCRPVCPARTPKRENCLFLPCAAAAQEAGFRPCLRCRPEASPGTPAWLGTSATVSRGLRLIDAGALDGGSVTALAGRLGIGERHLRRLFLEHLGATPIAVAQSRRVLFAKKLLDETRLPMTQVAFAAGFSSVRRFNDAMRRAYRRPPRALRRPAREEREPSPGDVIELRLPFRPPYHWSGLVDFLGPRALPGVEQVERGCYRRAVSIDGEAGWLEVRPARGANHLSARIRVARPGALIQIAERLRRLFDLGADPLDIAAQLRRDPRLAPRVRAARGLRVPGAWDGFELAVRAILGQQVTVKGATTLAGRLVARFGEPLPEEIRGEAGGRLGHVFPAAGPLAEAPLEEIGLPRARADALRALAAAVARGELVLDAPPDTEATLGSLRALPGVGEWTAQYIAMRALREPDAFPAGDLGLRRALADGEAPLPERKLAAASEAWRPWRAYAAMYLWRG